MALVRRARCLALDALLRCRPDQVRTFHFANGYRAYGIGGPGLLRHRPVQCRRVFSVAAGAGLAGAGPLGGAAGAERDEQGGEEQTIYTVKGPKQQVVIWMFVCGLLVFSIIIVGGLTRLTESGLSITEWKPVAGMWPPTSAREWRQEYQKYVDSPEFKKQRDPETFTMDDFRIIYYWEWGHRQLGRLIGVSFALPWLYFTARGYIPALIGLQGTIGWFMVASGLDSQNFEDGSRVRVSHLRLTLHLMGAFTLYSAFVWTAMSMMRPAVLPQITELIAARPYLRPVAKTTLGWTLFTAASGGLVAGLDAGLVYNEWPTMAGKLIPLDELYHLDPWWRSIFDHDVTVQFHHRMNAYATLALVAALSLLHARAPAPLQVTRALRLVQGVVVLQVALGITTVLNGAPIHLASAHQGGAVLLLTYVLVLVFMLRTAPPAWVMHAVKA